MLTFIVHVYEEEWLLHVDYNLQLTKFSLLINAFLSPTSFKSKWLK